MKIHDYVPGHFNRDIITQKIRRMMNDKPSGCCGGSAKEDNQLIGPGTPLACCRIPPEMSYADSERSH
jgi:hypothetical protein